MPLPAKPTMRKPVMVTSRTRAIASELGLAGVTQIPTSWPGRSIRWSRTCGGSSVTLPWARRVSPFGVDGHALAVRAGPHDDGVARGGGVHGGLDRLAGSNDVGGRVRGRW